MPDERDLRQAHLRSLEQGERVGAVGVAAAGGRQHAVAIGHDRRFAVPLALAGQHGGGGAVDRPGLEPPDQQGAHDAAVLPGHQRLGRGGAGEVDLLVLADQLLGLPKTPEQQLVDLRFPLAESGARERAERAPFVAVGARVGAVLLELHGVVVLVAEHVERAGDDARGAPGAQARRDDLVVELPPLGPIGLGHAGRILLDAGGWSMSDRERIAAGALVHRARVADLQAATQQGRVELQRRALDDRRAPRVDNDPDTTGGPDHVVVLGACARRTPARRRSPSTRPRPRAAAGSARYAPAWRPARAILRAAASVTVIGSAIVLMASRIRPDRPNAQPASTPAKIRA